MQNPLFKPLEFQEDELSELIMRYGKGYNANVNVNTVANSMTISSSDSGSFKMKKPLISTLPKEWEGTAIEKENVSSIKV